MLIPDKWVIHLNQWVKEWVNDVLVKYQILPLLQSIYLQKQFLVKLDQLDIIDVKKLNLLKNAIKNLDLENEEDQEEKFPIKNQEDQEEKFPIKNQEDPEDPEDPEEKFPIKDPEDLADVLVIHMIWDPRFIMLICKMEYSLQIMHFSGWATHWHAV